MSGKYSEKLKDPRWQKKRLEILSRDEWMCQYCYDSSSTLHIHHRYYIRNTDPWDYPPEALVTLCESCHEAETTDRPHAEALLLEAMKKVGFYSADVQRIAEGINKMKLIHASEIVASAYEAAFASRDIQSYLLERMFENLTGTKNGVD